MDTFGIRRKLMHKNRLFGKLSTYRRCIFRHESFEKFWGSYTELRKFLCMWLRECCRQVEAEVISNSRNNIHHTTYKEIFSALYLTCDQVHHGTGNQDKGRIGRTGLLGFGAFPVSSHPVKFLIREFRQSITPKGYWIENARGGRERGR